MNATCGCKLNPKTEIDVYTKINLRFETKRFLWWKDTFYYKEIKYYCRLCDELVWKETDYRNIKD